MKQTMSVSKMIVPIVLMSMVILAPTAAPIITPYPVVRMSLTCQSQTVGSVFVIDAQGHTHNQVCNAVTPVTFGYPLLFPAASAPWHVIVTARSIDSRTGHPHPCRFIVTSMPVHLHCAANSTGQFAVEFDLTPTVAISESRKAMSP